MKKLAPSRPNPHADEGDDNDSEGDQDLVNLQAGPSTYHPSHPRSGAVHHVHPAPILPTDHGLPPLNAIMVSTLSSTDLSTVSNTTAAIQQITEEVSQFIQGSMHSQEHVSPWLS